MPKRNRSKRNRSKRNRSKRNRSKRRSSKKMKRKTRNSRRLRGGAVLWINNKLPEWAHLKPIHIFLIDEHAESPEILGKKLEELSIKKIAYLQEHWRGEEGEIPRKDEYYDWQAAKAKIPENIEVKIFTQSPPHGANKGGTGEEEDAAYQEYFIRSMEKYNNFSDFDAIIISTGHSYPIGSIILDMKKKHNLIRLFMICKYIKILKFGKDI